MDVRRRFKIAVLLVATALFASPLYAQFRSSVEGVVTDSLGAVIPGAKIVLTNLDTGVSQTIACNGSGFYHFPSLPPGTYKLAASHNGFATTVEDNIVVQASEVRTVSLQLKPGAVTTEITVTGAAPPIQLSEAKVATNISGDQVRELPLRGGNVLGLISMTPGVTGTGTASGSVNDNDIFSLVGNPSVNAGGQRGSANAFYIDNTSATSNPDPGTYNLIPNTESIQEFHIATNDYSAEYGHSASMVVQAITRGGTNRFHGSLFEHHQDNDLTARNEFQNSASADPVTGRVIPVTRRNEFGGSFGGPIQKDKTFFFVSWDQLLSSQPVVFQQTVETPDFVNFMQKNFPNNVSTLLLSKFQPQTHGLNQTQTVADVLGQPCTTTGPLGMPCSMPLLGVGVLNVPGTRNGLQFNLRGDRYFRDSKDRFYVSYFRRTQDSLNVNPRPGFQSHFLPVAHYANLDWTHTFSSTTVNDAAFGFTRTLGTSFCGNCQVPAIGIGGGLAGFGTGFAPAVFIQNDFHWRDVLSMVHGKHTFKAGADIFDDQENDLFSATQQRPSYFFNNVFDFANDKPLQEFGINFDMRNGGPAFQDLEYRVKTYGFFFQDDWKVLKNLSINSGLRWDFSSNPVENHGRLAQVLLGSGTTFEQQIANASVGIVPSLLRNHRIWYFAPRLGFAYAPFKSQKLSVRGGFGVFYDRWPNIVWSDATRFNPPFESGITANALDPTGPQPVFGLCSTNTAPFTCAVPPGVTGFAGLNSRGGSPTNLSAIGGTAPDLKQAYSINRFFGLQYAITPNWVAEADYIGSNNIHLYTMFDRNRCAGCGFNGRPNPFFSSITYTDNSGWSRYNGGTFTLTKKPTHGLSFQVAYTIGKTVSVLDATGPGRDSSQAPVIDAYNLNAQRGLSSFDIPQALSFYTVWDLPKLAATNRWLRGVAGGWEIGTVTSLQAGYPATVIDTRTDFNNDGMFFDVPNALPGAHVHCDRGQFLTGCLNPANFVDPPLGQQGNAGRNTFRGPGYANVDFSAGKQFHLRWFDKEGATLRIRGELFNLFNRVNLTGYDTNLADGSPATGGTFGTATGVFNPRTVQLSGRIEF